MTMKIKKGTMKCGNKMCNSSQNGILKGILFIRLRGNNQQNSAVRIRQATAVMIMSQIN